MRMLTLIATSLALLNSMPLTLDILLRPSTISHLLLSTRRLIQRSNSIIAITGLGGHAYGSWRGKGNLGRMWLRHFLSKDLPQCRTMIYGYNSKLSSRGIGTIEDYSREFLEGIKKVRGTKEVSCLFA